MLLFFLALTHLLTFSMPYMDIFDCHSQDLDMITQTLFLIHTHFGSKIKDFLFPNRIFLKKCVRHVYIET